MHAGGGAPGGSWAEPQAMRMRSKGTCQSAKSSTTGNSGDSGDREQWRKLWKESTKVCARAR